MPYSTINADFIIETARVLERRILERFPQAGLCGVAGELITLGIATKAEAKELEQPIWWLRVVIGLVILLGGAIFVFLASEFPMEGLAAGTIDIVQGIEAGLNTLVLAGAGFYTLVKGEERIKQKRVLKGLHGFRSLIHIIDMHQLTKDPSALSRTFVRTESSPQRTMDAEALGRYLDYCSELLSLTGKFAALYAQSVNDRVVVDAVNDVETLSTNLSRKIWQKIMLIDRNGELKR
ncbi:MAG: hypothetical protein R3D45_10240 [Rhizobiaceae bacterium]